MEQKAFPANWWGGQPPWFTAQEILFKYLRVQPVEQVISGKLDHYLDAIDKANLNANAKVFYICAFYVRHSMTERAKAFRQAAQKLFPYEQDSSFNQVDQNPSLYK
jgi:hypothetical protein